ncbi:MAG: alpha-1,2-fucosyltransferase [Lachnospiraceae bacterium]|nr:alpha-1,2-fucosyltransferase [Lachnospiraceae bacterium]
MVIIRLQGGLGNQLFQYALYRQLLAQGFSVKIDEVSGFVGDRQRRPGLKEAFGVSYEAASSLEVDTLRDAFLDPFSRIRRKLTGRRSKEWEEPDGRFYPEVLAMEDAYLNGYFQSESYFPDPAVQADLAEMFAENIRRRLKNDMSFSDTDAPIPGSAGPVASHPEPPKGPGTVTKSVRESMTDTSDFAGWAARIAADGGRSVSLHIRRGDYLKPDTAETHGGICTERYYEKAVAQILAEVPNAVFYVFSDDPAYAAEWISRHRTAGEGEFRLIAVKDPAQPQTASPAEDHSRPSDNCTQQQRNDVSSASAAPGPNKGSLERDVQSLLLMRCCRHHILANSSFSWWGAWEPGAVPSSSGNTLAGQDLPGSPEPSAPDPEPHPPLLLAPSRWFNNRAFDAIYTDRMRRIEG